VDITDQPAVVDIAHDALDRGKGEIHIGHIVHGQNDPGDQLNGQTNGQDAAEGPPVVQVLGRREVEGLALDDVHDRQALVEPLGEGRLGLVTGRMSAH